MKAKYVVVVMGVVLMAGCMPKEPVQKPAQGRAEKADEATQVVDKLAPMPESIAVVTAVPEAVVAVAETRDTGDIADVEAAVSDTAEAERDETEGAGSADADVVFDLARVELDPAALRERGIELHELNNVRILVFTTNSSPLVLKADNLPTGAVQRTYLGVGCRANDAPLVLVEYGRAGTPGTWFYSAVDVFSVYGCDLHCDPNNAPGEWVAIAMTYDGKNIRIYVNGEHKHTKALAIDTQASNLIMGTRRSSGLISELKFWNRCMDDSEIKLQSEAALSKINDR